MIIKKQTSLYSKTHTLILISNYDKVSRFTENNS